MSTSVSVVIWLPLMWKEMRDLAFLTPFVIIREIYFSSRRRQLMSRCWILREDLRSFCRRSLNLSTMGVSLKPTGSAWGSALFPLKFRFLILQRPPSWDSASKIRARSCPSKLLLERSRYFKPSRWGMATARPDNPYLVKMETFESTRVCRLLSLSGTVEMYENKDESYKKYSLTYPA